MLQFQVTMLCNVGQANESMYQSGENFPNVLFDDPDREIVLNHDASHGNGDKASNNDRCNIQILGRKAVDGPFIELLYKAIDLVIENNAILNFNWVRIFGIVPGDLSFTLPNEPAESPIPPEVANFDVLFECNNTKQYTLINQPIDLIKNPAGAKAATAAFPNLNGNQKKAKDGEICTGSIMNSADSSQLFTVANLTIINKDLPDAITWLRVGAEGGLDTVRIKGNFEE